MQAARRTVTLFRQTHYTARTLRSSSSTQTSQSQRHASLTQPRHSFTTPSIPATILPTTAASTLTISPTSTSLSIGFASGTLGAMCGVGGAVFAIPALTRFSSLPQRIAAGNSLAAVTAVAIASAASFHSESALDTSVALPLALSASLLTPFGARAARSLDPAVLQRALGGFMLLLAPALPVRAALSRRRANADADGAVDGAVDLSACVSGMDEGTRRTVVLASSGAVIGLTSGILGISGGSLFTPVIALMYPDMPFTTVMGTSFAAMVLPTAIAALSYARMRMMAPALLPALVIGAAVGARLGANLAFAVPDMVLQYGFAAVFAVMGLRTLRISVVRKGAAGAVEAVRRGMGGRVSTAVRSGGRTSS